MLLFFKFLVEGVLFGVSLFFHKNSVSFKDSVSNPVGY